MNRKSQCNLITNNRNGGITMNKTLLVKNLLSLVLVGLIILSLAACGSSETGSSTDETQPAAEAATSAQAESTAEAASVRKLSESEITINDSVENSTGGEHAIKVDGETASYSNMKVVKTGDSSQNDEADFYGDNAAVFATNSGTLTLSDMVITTDGTHANAVFSYGEGTSVNISDSYIKTTGNCSGGLMTTGGGTMNASDLTIETSGNSSAAIRSDRGGGTVTVDGGYYSTSGKGSPVIYSTADITVSNAELNSNASEGVVVEGKNSVTLKNVTLNADHNTHNSDKSDNFNAVMIYQSMSGDAAQGTSSFTMEGGGLTNSNGDIFFVTNTTTDISLSDATIINNDSEGCFLRAAAAGWGNSGSNGGQVNLNASKQTINGDMLIDDVSVLNLYLKDNSAFTGAINSDGKAGSVYVELTGDSKWTLTADSYINSLTCDTNSIDLNGHTLYVNGVAYTAGSASTGSAIEFTVSSSDNGRGAPPDMPGDMGGTPPSKPD